MRPLTAADRVPQVGDVLIDTRQKYLPLTVWAVAGRWMWFLETHRSYSLKNAEWWHYISRADNGAVDTEAP